MVMFTLTSLQQCKLYKRVNCLAETACRWVARETLLILGYLTIDSLWNCHPSLTVLDICELLYVINFAMGEMTWRTLKVTLAAAVWLAVMMSCWSSVEPVSISCAVPWYYHLSCATLNYKCVAIVRTNSLLLTYSSRLRRSIYPLHRAPRARHCCPTCTGPVPFLKIAPQASARGRDWPVPKSYHRSAEASARCRAASAVPTCHFSTAYFVEISNFASFSVIFTH